MRTPTENCRRDILGIFQAGVAAADPYRAVKNVLHADNKFLQIGLDTLDAAKLRTGNWPNIHLIAFGKAACAMAAAAQEAVPTHQLAGKGIAVTTHENAVVIENVLTFPAGHPLPDAAGLQAARLIAERMQSVKSGDLVLVLISGGGSALLPLPVATISLEEKIVTTNLLLACGASIDQINCVRKHLSQLKGGGLAKMAAAADLHAMVLSDVLGDDVSAIASGPTVADDTRFSDAIAVLKSFKVWEQAPVSVKNYLLQGEDNRQPETPKSGDIIFKNCSHTLIGSNAISIDAVMNASAGLHYQVDLYSKNLCGEARIAAENLATYAKSLQINGLKQATAIIAGGETTVTLTGNGKGGRNQEMALAFALATERLDLTGWTFLSGGTDGRDGPTDAAGGVVDSDSLHRIRQAGLDPLEMLNKHDAYPALKAANDLLITGATGTNVADLQILLLHPSTE